tara:strand:- start:1928 stop:2419 length:492 start_codon:yes stop_codon:yes gene_type:complete
MSNSTGRVDINGPNIETKFSMIDKIPVNTNTNYLNSLTGNMERSILSDAYFSLDNIETIQHGIRRGVYDKSNGTILIDNQSRDNIVTVMRAMYLLYSKNLDINITAQIEALNKLVLDFCIKNVYSEAVAYLNYKRDASDMYTPMSAPIYSSKTNKTLQQKNFF